MISGDPLEILSRVLDALATIPPFEIDPNLTMETGQPAQGALMSRELDAIVRMVLKAIECPTGGAVLIDPQTQLLLASSLVGFSDEQAGMWHRTVAGSKLAHHLGQELTARLLAGEVVVMDWLNPPLPRGDPKFGARNAMLARIAMPDEFFGVFGYDRGDDEPRYSDADKALCAALARCIAVALSRRLHIQRQLLAQEQIQSLIQTIRELEAGQPRLSEDGASGPCDLIELVRTVIAEQRAEVSDGTFVLVTALPPGRLMVRANAQLIRSVLKRLLANAQANALNFAPADGSIRVRVRRIADEAWVSVVDIGHGLTHEEQEHIWNAIHQTITQDTPGTTLATTDLGLARCRSIIHQHGGHIGVESLPGMGAHFWFRLPCLPTE